MYAGNGNREQNDEQAEYLGVQINSLLFCKASSKFIHKSTRKYLIDKI